KIDQVTVWDSGGSDGKSGNSTANFLSGLASSLPPIHDLAAQVGIKLPAYLGELDDETAIERLREIAEQLDSGDSSEE
ncbi:MAG: flotillin family protein, partial [bacterium]|nr:flotillin family protein [bacterium]